MLYFFNDTVLNAAQSNDEFFMLNYYVSFLEYEHFYVTQSKIASIFSTKIIIITLLIL